MILAAARALVFDRSWYVTRVVARHFLKSQGTHETLARLGHACRGEGHLSRHQSLGQNHSSDNRPEHYRKPEQIRHHCNSHRLASTTHPSYTNGCHAPGLSDFNGVEDPVPSVPQGDGFNGNDPVIDDASALELPTAHGGAIAAAIGSEYAVPRVARNSRVIRWAPEGGFGGKPTAASRRSPISTRRAIACNRASSSAKANGLRR